MNKSKMKNIIDTPFLKWIGGNLISYSKAIFISLSLILSLSYPTQAQESAEEGGKFDEAKKEIAEFYNAFLDWAIISYNTYTGQHEGELNSVFAKVKGNLDGNPQIKQLVGELQEIQSELGLKGAIQDFTNESGIKVYVAPSRAVEGEGFYTKTFNRLLMEGAQNPVAPYIIVSPTVNGSKSKGYTISYETETSPEVHANKYHLTSPGTKNPFNELAGSANKQLEMGKKLREGLKSGMQNLRTNVTQNLKPPLYLDEGGDMIRPGDEKEFGMEEEGTTIRLVATEKNGSPTSKKVTWTCTPEGLELNPSGNTLDFPIDEDGLWTVSARAGNDVADATIRVVNFSLDWKGLVKQILYDALESKLEQSKNKQDSLQAISGDVDGELAAQLALVEAANYPLENEGIELEPLYETPVLLTGNDTTTFYSNKTRAEGFKKLRKFKKIAVDILKEVNMAAVIDITIENPDKFDEVLNGIIDNSGTLALELFTSLKDDPEQRKERFKEIVFDYINAELEKQADAEFAAQHYDQPEIPAEVLPTQSDKIPELTNPNYYINPLVEFPGKAEFIEELEAEIAAAGDNPPFIVVNYSQDLSQGGALNRLKAGRPKGIDPDRDYCVIYQTHIPGSVKVTVMSAGTDIIVDRVLQVMSGKSAPLAGTEVDQTDSGVTTYISRTLLTPAGIPFTVPTDVTQMSFVSSNRAPYGTLTGFWRGSDYYVGVYKGDQFKGYSKLVDALAKEVEKDVEGEIVYYEDDLTHTFDPSIHVTIGYPHSCKIYMGTVLMSEFSSSIPSGSSTGAGKLRTKEYLHYLDIELTAFDDEAACGYKGAPDDIAEQEDCDALYEEYKDSPLMKSDILRAAIEKDPCLISGIYKYGEGLGYETDFMKGLNTMVGGFAGVFTATVGAAVTLPILIEGGALSVSSEKAIEKSTEFTIGVFVDAVAQYLIYCIKNDLDDLSFNDFIKNYDVAQAGMQGLEATYKNQYVALGQSCLFDVFFDNGKLRSKEELTQPDQVALNCATAMAISFASDRVVMKGKAGLKSLIKQKPDRFIRILFKNGLSEENVVNMMKRLNIRELGEDRVRALFFKANYLDNIKVLGDQVDDFVEDLSSSSSLMKFFRNRPSLDYLKSWKLLSGFLSLRKVGFNIEAIKNVAPKFKRKVNGEWKEGFEGLELVFKGKSGGVQALIDNLKKTNELFGNFNGISFTGIKTGKAGRVLGADNIEISRYENKVLTITKKGLDNNSEGKKIKSLGKDIVIRGPDGEDLTDNVDLFTDGKKHWFKTRRVTVIGKNLIELKGSINEWVGLQRSLATSNNQLRKFNTATVVYNKKTGKYYYGANQGIAKSGDGIHEYLAKKLPKESTNNYKLGNCSECDGVNKALNDGSNWSDLQMHTVGVQWDTGSTFAKPMCSNCEITFEGIEILR
ncbi:hypothetical protein [Reichenbachiella versicolor]|uniref:hypothetical protein n=1 Tax=Reichenbachiella versicolor TaxID=1821036 RepID=UPI000D6E90CD|nr:hypothetical protein [Reichenbachiella versicolor]